jgi:hypothetical protein
MIGEDDCEESGGMKIGRGNRSTRRKPAPAPLCPPQIPLTRPGFEPGPPRDKGLIIYLNYIIIYVKTRHEVNESEEKTFA